MSAKQPSSLEKNLQSTSQEEDELHTSANNPPKTLLPTEAANSNLMGFTYGPPLVNNTPFTMRSISASLNDSMSPPVYGPPPQISGQRPIPQIPIPAKTPENEDAFEVPVYDPPKH